MTFEDALDRAQAATGRKWTDLQREELIAKLKSECLPVDAMSVADDLVWTRRQGETLPSPLEFLDRCLRSKASRERSQKRRSGRGMRPAADSMAFVDDLVQESYQMRVYAKAFGALFKSRCLHVLEGHGVVVTNVIDRIGPPAHDQRVDPLVIRDTDSERLAHLKRAVNACIDNLEFYQFE